MSEHSVTLGFGSSATLNPGLALRFNFAMQGDDHLIAALRALCEREGGYKAVADQARVSPENLWQIIRGIKLPSGNARNVGPKLREKLTNAFPDWLAANHSVGESRPEYSTGLVIPEYATGGAMGPGVLLRDQPGMINSWHVTPEWVQKNVHHITSPKNLAIVTGFGDSMRPLYNPGDPLLVDRGVTAVEFDGIYFFRIEQEGYIKRLQRIPGTGLRAISENKAYESWNINADMDFEVFARVVKVWRGEDF